MNGQQIVDNCRDIAKRQFPETSAMGEVARALCEIGLLRTKVLELSKKVNATEADARADRMDAATEARWQERNDRDGVPHGTY
jgi:hypothetical protein